MKSPRNLLKRKFPKRIGRKFLENLSKEFKNKKEGPFCQE